MTDEGDHPMISHHGYTGVFEFEAEDSMFTGQVIDLADLICFEGTSVEELEKSMARAVDQYHGVPPYRETRQYVRRVLNYYRRYDAEFRR